MVKSFFVNVRFKPKLYQELHSVTGKIPSDIVRESVATWLQYYKMDYRKIELRENENYTILGKTRCGKTMLIQSLLNNIQKQKVIMDPHKEYERFGKVKKVRHFAELPLVGESTQIVNKVWCQGESKKLISSISRSNDNFVIQPEFDDIAMEQLFIDEFFKILLQEHILGSKKPKLLLVEESNRYKDSVFPIVSQGLKTGIQTILVSQFPLSSKVMLNTTIILGHLWSNLLQKTDLPQNIVDTCRFLKLYEWIWFDVKGNAWRKYVSYTPPVLTG